MYKKIKGFEDYSVDVNGNVRSDRSGRLLNMQIRPSGYVGVTVRINKTRFNMSAHRAVALAYLPNPENLPQVNHKDGDKENNHVSNLEWCTAQYNIQHSFDTGLNIPNWGEDTPQAIMTNDVVHDICQMMESGLKNIDVVNKYNLNEKTVSNIRTGLRWSNISALYKIPRVNYRRCTKEEVVTICEMLQEKEDIDNIASSTGISKEVIYLIKNRVNHVKISKHYKW